MDKIPHPVAKIGGRREPAGRQVLLIYPKIFIFFNVTLPIITQ